MGAMKFDLNKRETQRVITALYEAIDASEVHIDACRVSLKMKNGKVQSFIPSCFWRLVHKRQRDIAAYKRLISKIGGGL